MNTLYRREVDALEKAHRFSGAAKLAEANRDWGRAIKNYMTAMDLLDAARIYERLGRHDAALELYQEEISILERARRFREAARLCEDSRDYSRALVNYLKIRDIPKVLEIRRRGNGAIKNGKTLTTIVSVS